MCLHHNILYKQYSMDTFTIVIILIGIFTAYTFIAFQSQAYKYVGDFRYIMLKTGIIISTISVGYFSFLLSGHQRKFPLIGPYVASLQEAVAVPIIRKLVLLISAVWFALAVSLLPFNHTVYNAADTTINEPRTRQLMTAHRIVYTAPFYILFIILMFNLFFMLVALCLRDEENAEWFANSEAKYAEHPVLKKITSNWKHMNMNVGFFFDRPESNANPDA